MKRATLVLDGPWYFRIDRNEQGEARGWHQPQVDQASWLKVMVPSNWDTYLPELFGYAGHAWYRRTFRPDPEWQSSRIHLRFEGSNYETTVWLNGQSLGIHSGGFDPFEYDVTDRLDWSGENTLAVRVDNWPKVGRVPNSLAGWWNYGGIYRSVKLLAFPKVRLADVFVRAEPPAGKSLDAPLTVDVTVINDAAEPVEVLLAARVSTDGEPARLSQALAASGKAVAPGAPVKITLAATMLQARLWSPASPHLYTLHLDLKQGSTTVDELDVNFGVRRFEVRGTQLYLNGEPIVLTGFNRHEEYAGHGRVDPGGMLEADLRLIQQLNGNMVRMHYQAHPDLYDFCDRNGLLVFAEIPVWQVGVKDLAEWSDPGVRQTAETMLRTLIGELKNHPSVVIWSVGNECATNRAEARPLIGHLAEVARSLDATRPVAYVTMWGREEVCYDLVDLPCANFYFGLRASEMGEVVDKIHARAPEKPLLVTEFGHEAILGLHGEGYGTEDEQAIVLEKNWRVLRERRDFVPGGLIWCLADYWHMPAGPDFRWMNRIYFCHGLTTLGRQPKRALDTVRRFFEQRG